MYTEINIFSSELSSSQCQKFLPRLGIVSEHTGHVACYCFRSLLLNSPHHHAHVPFECLKLNLLRNLQKLDGCF